MFDALKERFDKIFTSLRGKGKLSEEDVNQALREVRRALLEADVNYKIVKDFIDQIRTRAVGKETFESITPAQHVLTIVYEELIRLIGSETTPLAISPKPPTKYMLVGLQGSGKTTSCVKIAKMLSSSHKPMVVACDLKRPAAVEQLRVLAEKAGIAFYGPDKGETDVLSVARHALEHAENRLVDLLLFDTAGRLQIDTELMKELHSLKGELLPHEILLVVDSMTGQEAVNVATVFNNDIGLTGVVLSKLDGDARGGAALAIRAATGVPIKLLGTGEKIEDLELFNATQLAQRILGMGDVLGLVEKVQQITSQEEIAQIEESFKKSRFSMDDLLLQLRQLQKMGPIDKVIEMLPIPGISKNLKNAPLDPNLLRRSEAIILSMTPKERRNPEIIKGSRRRRIAQGSGTTVQMVNQLLHQYNQMKDLMKAFNKPGKKNFKMQQRVRGLFR